MTTQSDQSIPKCVTCGQNRTAHTYSFELRQTIGACESFTPAPVEPSPDSEKRRENIQVSEAIQPSPDQTAGPCKPCSDGLHCEPCRVGAHRCCADQTAKPPISGRLDPPVSPHRAKFYDAVRELGEQNGLSNDALMILRIEAASWAGDEFRARDAEIEALRDRLEQAEDQRMKWESTALGAQAAWSDRVEKSRTRISALEDDLRVTMEILDGTVGDKNELIVERDRAIARITALKAENERLTQQLRDAMRGER